QVLPERHRRTRQQVRYRHASPPTFGDTPGEWTAKVRAGWTGTSMVCCGSSLSQKTGAHGQLRAECSRASPAAAVVPTDFPRGPGRGCQGAAPRTRIRPHDLERAAKHLI